MKTYATNTKDTCWKDSLACLLEIEPKYVPDFVKKYGDSYMDETRRWLKEKFNLGMVYVPSNQFMETGPLRQNGPIGPEGYSLAYVTMEGDQELAHAVVCFNGGVFYDNGDDRHEEYNHIDGYYVLYDLAGPKARKGNIYKKKKRIRKVRKNKKNKNKR